METENIGRCRWCNMANPAYVAYHDHEWGVPVHDDGKLFELLLLESFQAGLSWECILNKREDGQKLQSLLQDKGIVRNRLKIRAAVTNAQVFLKIQREYGSFDRYIWGFTGGSVLFETGLATSPLSDAVSKDLRQKGMKFMGSTVVYAYLQAVGVINSHEEGCWLAKKKKEEDIKS